MEASALSAPAGLGRIAVSARLLRLRTDDQLVALFRAGDDEAFRAIHDRYRQRLFGYARQMLSGSRSDAEDALQDVFLRAYHSLRADSRPVTLRAWLYRVAHNRCIDQLRRPAPAPADVFDLNRVPLHDPLAEAERREDLRRLVEDVRRLPEHQRSALLMREMEGLTYAELGDALGVSIPAVKSLLVRARIGLVEAIEARDTACGDIRTDLASAHDRGVRASGRARRHMRECAGCREYRTALRGLDGALGALNPGSGPLATLAKLLGIGGAGSGAAAGGSAAAGGGAAAGSAVATGGLTTLGTGAAAATASKVAAVVAAAAVVGGGAAVEHRVHAAAPPARVAAVPVPERVVTPLATAATEVVLRHRSGAAPAPARVRRNVAGDEPTPAPAAADPVQGATPDPATDGPATIVDVAAASGGILAPADAADETPGTATGTPADPAQTPSGATTETPTGTGTATSGHGAGGGSATPATGPTGQSTGGPAPVAQGAATSTPPQG